MTTIKRPEWSPAYAIGSEAVDSQHERLFDLVSMLCDAQAGRCEHEVVDHAVNALYGYIRIHFKDEEALMEGIGYPELEAHRRQHDRFILAFDDLVIEHRNDADFCDRLAGFVGDWLVGHIMNEDTKIRAG